MEKAVKYLHHMGSIKIIIYSIFLLLFSNQVYSQASLFDEKISIMFVDEPLSNVLLKISKIAKVDFSYNPSLFATNKRVTIKAVNKPIKDILNEIIDDKTIEYKIIGNQAIIGRKKTIGKIDAEPVNTVNTGTKQNSDMKPVKEMSVKVSPENDEPEKHKSITITDTIKHIIIIDSVIRITHIDTIKQVTIIPFDSTQKKNNRFAIELFYNPTLPTLLVAKQNTIDQGVVNEIQEAETPLLSYNTGVNIAYTPGHFKIQLGANFGQFYVKKHYEHPFVSQTISHYLSPTYGWEKYVHDSTWTGVMWTYNYDSTYGVKYVWLNETFTDYKILKHTSTSTFTCINIPFMFGYSFNVGSRFAVTPKVGGMANILLSADGSTLAPLSDSMITKYSNLPVVTLNYSVTASIEFKFKLSNTIHLVVEPNFTKQLKSLYTKNYPVIYKFNFKGIKAGVEFIF